MSITEETGKAVRSFMAIMQQQPLSLALVVMNFVLIAYVFYSGSTIIEQRSKTTQMIVDWQKETDKLLHACVSEETIKNILDALGKKQPDKMNDIQHLLPPEFRIGGDAHAGARAETNSNAQ